MRYTVFEFSTLGGLKYGVVDTSSGDCVELFCTRNEAEVTAAKMNENPDDYDL